MDELTQLKEENKKLRNLLKELGYIFIDENIKLTTEKRIEIMMDYFKGRQDVYANQYFSKKTEKKGFAIACQNRFQSRCPKTRNKSLKCSSSCFQFLPKTITKEVIFNHIMKTNNGIGIYPLLENNTCYFLAIDFDGDFWFEELLSIYRVAKKYQVSCIMERSQSGNGGHLWIFFEDAIKALKARRLGEFLLTETMKQNKHIHFKSFDRMFPNQDYMPTGGFGNLIALPLQYDARTHHNSLFINEQEQPIQDSALFLMSTVKVKEQVIDQILNIHLDEIQNYFIDQLTPLDSINEKIIIQENTMLIIQKSGLSAKTINIIRRLASMYNPEYYLKQRLHKPIYESATPRVLCEYEENDYQIKIPRGLKNRLFSLISSDLIEYQKNCNNGLAIDIQFQAELRPSQKEAAFKLLQYDIGMIEAIPGFGKTIIALYLLSTLKVSTLIIVPTKELLNQWKEKIDEFIDYPVAIKKKDHFIGEYSGSKKKLKGNIDVALAPSLSKMEDKNMLDQYGLVIVDECHHASSDTFRNLLKNINSNRIYSFSATPHRKDQLEKIMHMYLGDIVYKTDKQELISKRTFEQVLIPRMTTFSILDEDINYADLLNQIYINQKRNYIILTDIQKEILENRNIIILTERIEHIDILYKQLKYSNYNVFCLKSTLSPKERHNIREQLNQCNHYLIIATSQLLGEGFDLPSLDTMFLTMPISWKGRLTQYVGRLHRQYDDKKIVKVYDYVDMNVKVLQNMFNKRLKTYKSEGYKTLENQNIVQIDQTIFDKSNYVEFLHSSMQAAQKNIIIFTQECLVNRVKRLYSFITSLQLSGIQIYVCLHNKNTYNQDAYHYLEGLGVSIKYSDLSVNAIMIDEKIVWTSSSSYLGAQNNDLFYVRISDLNIIEELKLNSNNEF